jgi:uncharacterized damage-inducible protein DinB
MMSRVPVWFERRFEFGVPVELFPNLEARLRGTPARLEELARGMDAEARVRKVEGKWSAQEHAGHLGDLEPLWLARVEDYALGSQRLTATDLRNRKTDEARHNGRPLEEVLAGFRVARARLMERLAGIDGELFGRAIPHPRMGTPMRLMDHLHFVAEHDDHHLARIWEVTS